MGIPSCVWHDKIININCCYKIGSCENANQFFMLMQYKLSFVFWVHNFCDIIGIQTKNEGRKIMKHLLILTSLLSLSACGVGFFDFGYYDKEKEPASVSVEDTANPANTAVTQMTTDLNNVTLNSSGGAGEYTFTLNGGVIDGLSGNGGLWHATRDGNSDYFVDDSTGARYQVKMFGNGNLTYSDFGTINGDNGVSMVFAGGNTDKHAGIYTDSEIAAIQNKEYVSDVMFTGTAVGLLKYDGTKVGTARTDAATLNVSGDSFALHMPFYSNGYDGSKNFYDVDVTGEYAYAKGGGDFNNNTATWKVYLNKDSNYAAFEKAFDSQFGLSGVGGRIDSYGADGATASEAVGWIGIGGYDSNKEDRAVFEAAFGVSK